MVLIEILDLIVENLNFFLFVTSNDEEYCVGDGHGSDVHEPRREA